MNKQTMTEAVLAAKRARGLRWDEIAEQIGMSPVWTASLGLGESSATPEIAHKLCAVLHLEDEVADALQVYPYKGDWLQREIPTDPLLYRFYEVLAVYGPSVKAVIGEKFGDGIMSAIDFTLDVEREQDPAGDRVKIVMSGKFLPYKRW